MTKSFMIDCADIFSCSCLALPNPPLDVDGTTLDYFKNIEIVYRPMKHYLAASISNKQVIYAVHNAMGKADHFLSR